MDGDPDARLSNPESILNRSARPQRQASVDEAAAAALAIAQENAMRRDDSGIKAVSRVLVYGCRSQLSDPEGLNPLVRYRFGVCEVDERRKLLTHRGVPIDIGIKPMETLLVLLRANGEVVLREDLLKAVWPEGFVSQESLWQSIRTIRKVLDPLCGGPAIKTLPRRGYRFVHCIERLPESTRAVIPAARSENRFLRVAFAGVALVGLFLLSFSGPTLRSHAVRPEDEQLYAIARHNLHDRNLRSLERAVREFRTIAARNPESSLALSGLAESLLLMGDYVKIAGGNPSAAVALTIARRATALGPRCPEAHAALGLAEMFTTGNGAGEFREALALDPGSVNARLWYGLAQLRAGNVDGARDELRVAEDLDPTSPAVSSWLARAAFYARDYAEAEMFSRRSLDVDPGRQDSIAILGLSYELRRRFTEAADEYRQLAAIDPKLSAVLLSHLYAASGDVVHGRRLLHEVRMSEAYETEFSADVASAYAAIGERQTALSILRTPRATAHLTIALNTLDPRLFSLRAPIEHRPI